MFDAARLRVFREVVQRGSLSAAAEALSFTQPAVSRQIAALEREAGAQLLERTPRGIRLTEPGRVQREAAAPSRTACGSPGVDGVSRAVGLEGTSGAVVAPGVGRDDEAVSFEEEVDFPAVDGVVDPGLREAVISADRQEEPLETAVRAVASRLVGLQCSSELGGSPVAGVGSGQGIEGDSQ